MTYKINNEDIIVWKGFKWHKLLTLDKYNISRVLVQLTTLSRYTHTAIYYSYLGREYLIQSGSIKGMHIIDITKEKWFRDNITNNVWDLYRFKANRRISNSFRKKILSEIIYMYENDKKSSRIGSYSVMGLINQFFINFFGKSFLKDTKTNKMFCSEMTHYYFTEDKLSFKYSPYDITNSDFYRKIL